MNDLHVEAAGIVIKDGGYKRPILDVAQEFLDAWADARNCEAVNALASLLAAYASAHDGPVIPPFAFHGDECLCERGTETWCRAVGCPRQYAPTPPRAEGA